MHFFLTLSVFLFTCTFLGAQVVTPAVKITPSVRRAYDVYGTSAISGEVAVVGAPLNDSLGSDAGIAFVYTQNGAGLWEETQILTASDGAVLSNFGVPAISGDYLVIGSYGADVTTGSGTLENAGAAYVFERNSSGVWVEVAKLTADDAAAGDNFGTRVAIDGRYIVVCASQQDYDADGNNFLEDAGAVYVFERTDGEEWLQVQKLTVSDRAAGDALTGVAIHESTFVVGSWFNDTDANSQQPVAEAGAAYVFLRDQNGTWTETQKLTAAQRSTNDFFGYSVAIFEDYLLVGAYGEDEGVAETGTIGDAGSAYLFRRSGIQWTQLQKICAPLRGAGDNFGRFVALYGNYALLGANRANLDASGTAYMEDAGSAYLYQRNAADQWLHIRTLVAPDRATDDNFGTVAIHGAHILVGAIFENEDANTLENAGSVYQFEIVNPVGIGENASDLSVTIWPNPAENRLRITTGEAVDQWTVTLRDVTGKLLNRTVYSATSAFDYDLAQPAGVYFIEIGSETATVVQRVVIAF